MLPLTAGWSVDDHLFKDLPALVEVILQESGAQRLHWIGKHLASPLHAPWHLFLRPLVGARVLC